MSDYKEIKKELESLRKELIDYISSQDEGQDLTEKFIQVRENDVATYELLMLIYQEFKTLQKINKKRLTSLMDGAINVKIKTIDKLLADEQGENKSSEPSTLYGFLNKHLTIKNIALIVVLLLSIFGFMFTLYIINSDAYTRVANDGLKLIEQTNNKGDK